jgi:hypothetical protein
MEAAFEVDFSNGLTACAVKVHSKAELSAALRELGLRCSSPTLVLVGGTGGQSDAESDRLHPLFVEVLDPLAEAVVDGGTDAGIMSLMGEAHAEMDATFPLVGVAAIGTIALPDAPFSPPDAAPLEPHHNHFVLVPGSEGVEEFLTPKKRSEVGNEPR